MSVLEGGPAHGAVIDGPQHLPGVADDHPEPVLADLLEDVTDGCVGLEHERAGVGDGATSRRVRACRPARGPTTPARRRPAGEPGPAPPTPWRPGARHRPTAR